MRLLISVYPWLDCNSLSKSDLLEIYEDFCPWLSNAQCLDLQHYALFHLCFCRLFLVDRKHFTNTKQVRPHDICLYYHQLTGGERCINSDSSLSVYKIKTSLSLCKFSYQKIAKYEKQGSILTVFIFHEHTDISENFMRF